MDVMLNGLQKSRAGTQQAQPAQSQQVENPELESLAKSLDDHHAATMAEQSSLSNLP
jgi:hypothetical protein